MNKLKEILFLKNIKGIGKSAIFTKYYDDLSSANDIAELKKVVQLRERNIENLDLDGAERKAKDTFKRIKNDKAIKAITAFDESYPDRLKVMGKKRPLVLYVKGDESILSAGSIAVVGTRHPIEWSALTAEHFVKKTTEISDRVIVSGLALGCDRIAHQTTVKEKKKTIAVLPSGVNMITPASHKKLAKDIIENGGCLVSEYEPDAIAIKRTYVERDAVIAALSDIVLAIECSEASGTMNTIRAANEFNIPLACCYKENLDQILFGGNEYMVHNYHAKKIVNDKDLEDLLSSAGKGKEVPEEFEQLTLWALTSSDEFK